MARPTSVLDVLPVRPPPDEADEDAAQRARLDALPDPLPRLPFLWILMGSVRSGKSVFISNAIRRWYAKVFARVIYCSPTVENDASLWHLLHDDDVAIITGDRLSKLDDVVAALVTAKMADPVDAKAHWLIVLDDCLGLLKPGGFVTHFATRYRHSRVSLLVSCQQLRALPPTIRANASAYSIWRSTNGRERAKLDEEFGEVIPHFLALYDDATAKPYHFLFVDLRRLRAFANLTTLMYDSSSR